MKAVKGKLLKKLKTIKSIEYLKPERILHVNSLDGYFSNSATRAPLKEIHEEPKKPLSEENICPAQEPEIIDVCELMKDLEDQEMEFGVNDKENITPKRNAIDESNRKSEKMSIWESRNGICEGKEFGDKESKIQPLSVSCFRPPDLDSNTLFDPNLLAAFEQAVMEVKAREAENIKFWEEFNVEPPLESQRIEEFNDPFLEFQEKCPPGGSDSVILYVTGLRGIRKTFEDCHKLRSLLENLRISFFERDMSMHSGYKEELFEISGGKVAPPRLFIKGRYIGGADEVLALHEQGKLKPLIEGIPIDDGSEGPCEGCGGIRFIVCFNCNGSRRIVPEGSGGEVLDCKECNENGVNICPFCC